MTADWMLGPPPYKCGRGYNGEVVFNGYLVGIFHCSFSLSANSNSLMKSNIAWDVLKFCTYAQSVDCVPLLSQIALLCPLQFVTLTISFQTSQCAAF